MKKSAYKRPVTERIGVPKITRDKEGNAILNCPFCHPTHPLRPDNNSACGTMVQVRAVQTVFKAKFDKRLICVKCAQGGGEMVMFQNGFIHTHDCMPGVATLVEPPVYSKMAKFVHGLHPEIRNVAEKMFGEIIQVQEVFPDGTKTGVVLGYFFKKE